MKISSDVVVRRATVEDRYALNVFYHQAYGERAAYKYPERWEWLYLKNPFNEKAELPIWIAEEHGMIVGHTGAMIIPLTIQGIFRVGAWSVDTYVLPPYRGTGIGKILQRENQAAWENFLSLSYSSINEKIKKDLGQNASKNIHQYRRFSKLGNQNLFQSQRKKISRYFGKRLGNFIYFSCQFLGIFKVVRCFLEKILIAEKAPSPNASHLKFKLVESTFDERVRRLFEVGVGDRGIQATKNLSYLSWKYIKQPFAKFTSFYVYQAEELIGLVIYRLPVDPEPNVGIIAELLIVDKSIETFECVIGHAISFFEQNDCDEIQFLNSEARYERSLQTWDFFKTGSLRLMGRFFRDFDEDELKRVPVDFSLGDHDLDQYPNIRSLSVIEIIKFLRHD